ncbi:MAG: autotransporter-associated beta strand repeat-containing protein [Pirellulales bacterium]
MKFVAIGLAALSAAFAGTFATAQSWNLAGDGSWNTAANWNPNTVPNAVGAAVTFNGAATGQTANRTITLDGQQTIGSVVFNNDVNSNNSITTGTGTAPALTFDNGGAGATITTQGSGTGNNTFTASFRMNDNVTAFVNNTTASSAAGSLNITGVITGTGGFTKDGVGLATFGTNSKTYTGPTVINNGRMRISNAAQPSATSSFTVNNGGQVDFISSATYSLGTGTLTLNGAGPTSGPHAAFPGAIRPDTNLAIVVTNAVNLQTTATVHMQGAATGSLTFNGAISGSGGFVAGAAVHDANIGQIVFNTSTNSYTGGTTVNAGTLVAGLASTNAFGTGNVSVLSANSVFAGSSARISLVAGETNAIDDGATLSLAGGSVAAVADDGYANIGAGVNETVGGLILGGVAQTTPGTYGATGSGANFIFDEYFSGTGLITLAPANVGVAGDYNNNGVVDAADYVLWRNGGPLQNEVDNPGILDANDYAAWRARFGNTSGAGTGLGAAGIPEPGTLSLIFLVISAGYAMRRGR